MWPTSIFHENQKLRHYDALNVLEVKFLTMISSIKTLTSVVSSSDDKQLVKISCCYHFSFKSHEKFNFTEVLYGNYWEFDVLDWEIINISRMINVRNMKFSKTFQMFVAFTAFELLKNFPSRQQKWLWIGKNPQCTNKPLVIQDLCCQRSAFRTYSKSKLSFLGK